MIIFSFLSLKSKSYFYLIISLGEVTISLDLSIILYFFLWSYLPWSCSGSVQALNNN